jgi:hypothetical protein
MKHEAMVAFHAYYVPAQRLVRGTDDPDVTALLYATYMKHHDVSIEPGRYDGASAYQLSECPTPVMTVIVEREGIVGAVVHRQPVQLPPVQG